jgi:hypothetical protein
MSSQAEAHVTGKAIKLNAAGAPKNEPSLLKSLAFRKESSVASSVGSNEAGTKFSNNLRNSLSKTDPNKGNLILNEKELQLSSFKVSQNAMKPKLTDG